MSDFRSEVRSILIDRASLDEHIEEFFDEVLDDIEAAHVRYPPGLRSGGETDG